MITFDGSLNGFYILVVDLLQFVGNRPIFEAVQTTYLLITAVRASKKVEYASATAFVFFGAPSLPAGSGGKIRGKMDVSLQNRTYTRS
jgi:hypothetical protein